MTLKLGFHFLPGDRTEARQWYALQPATVKFAGIDLDWASDNRALVNDAPPGCVVVGKLAEAPFEFESDPVGRAQEHVQHFLPMIDALPRVDVWEGLNEVGIMADEPERMRQYADFCAEFARQISMAVKKAGIGAWATGNPPALDQWEHWQAALLACREFGAIFTRHNYGPLDNFLGLRHRADRLKWNDLDIGPLPVLITECGADFCGVPGWASYKAMGWSIERYYADWIKPFTLAINQDPYVIGAHLFTLNGGGGWADYDVAHSGLLELLQRDIAELQVQPAPVVAQGQTTMAEYAFLTTLLGEGGNSQKLADFTFAVHDWLAKHGGNIDGFCDALPWWKATPLPANCRLRPEFGSWLLYWDVPGFSARPTLFPNPVTWQMKVWEVQSDMVKVSDNPLMWIMAAMAEPV